MSKKLVLFDIDGTLIYHVGPRHWNEQYAHGMQVAYNITEGQDYERYTGSVERDMAWEIVQKFGVSRQDFLSKFPIYVEAMEDHLTQWSKKGPLFQSIPDAVALVHKFSTHKEYILGLLTGNAKRLAQWKLTHTNLSHYFSFGLYGEEADDRIALAKLVFEKATKELKYTFAPRDIIVIGDTIHDIRCGKAIGAVTIAVTTGLHGDAKQLAAEHPDLVVDSLMDPAILSLFSLK